MLILLYARWGGGGRQLYSDSARELEYEGMVEWQNIMIWEAIVEYLRHLSQGKRVT